MGEDILEDPRQVLRVQHHVCAAVARAGASRLEAAHNAKRERACARAWPTGISCFRDSAAASPAMNMA